MHVLHQAMDITTKIHYFDNFSLQQYWVTNYIPLSGCVDTSRPAESAELESEAVLSQFLGTPLRETSSLLSRT